MCSDSEAGSYLRPIDSCITQRKAQGPSRTCNESQEEEGASDRTVHNKEGRLVVVGGVEGDQNHPSPYTLHPTPNTLSLSGQILRLSD